MRAALNALTDELKRLKSTGVKSVPVSAESLEALRKVIAARKPAGAEAGRATTVVGSSEAATTMVAQRTLVRPSAREPEKAPPPPPASEPVVPSLPPPPSVTLPDSDKAAQMAWLREQVLTNPVCVANVRPGKKIVVGVGSLDSKIMFVGEAPGAEEEVHGEPFIGPAGQLLTRMIGGMGLKREDVYIGNIMNWRPQMPTSAGAEQVGNRPPTPEELAYCLPYLRAQIEIVKPDLLVALGATAAQGLLGADSFKTLGEIRGRWNQFAGRPVMVTYHPSYILRNGSNRSKRAIWEDLMQVMERANLPISEKQRGYFLDK